MMSFLNPEADHFLSQYDKLIVLRAQELRQMLYELLPDITEQPDLPARMVAYVYGQRYVDMVCTIIPSQKGLKLGFAWGNKLPDPAGLLEGSGKISRYVVIKTDRPAVSPELKALVLAALEAYKTRTAGI